MQKTVWVLMAIIFSVPAAQASDIMEWLNEHAVGSASNTSRTVVADAATLLTLEDKQSEMYPQPSPDGRYLLTLTRQGKDAWVSRRFSENGDPANRVSFDDRALDSMRWLNNEKVYYLSDRAGGLALWEKISDGEGMQRRIQRLDGLLTQPILLADSSIIATRLKPVSRKSARIKTHRRSKHDDFNNWTYPGFIAEIMRFDGFGAAHVLSEGVNPSLSPDGQWIAFAMPTGRSIHLFRMRTDGSELIQITDARSVDVQPSWSTDGKSILFTSNRADNDFRHPGKSGWDIWSIGIDGRNLVQITFDKARDGAAQMGRDGRIYFHSDRKVSKALRIEHQLKSGSARGYHIWTIKRVNNR
ncbi:MAG: TolB family protein [Mariprofundus sp.]